MKYWLFIGRWQCLPPHKGHEMLIRTKLDKGEAVCVALRDTKKDEKNPYSVSEREEALYKMFEKEAEEGRFLVIEIPDIKGVAYGRGVGYEVEQVKLEDAIEAISATNIRNQLKDGKN